MNLGEIKAAVRAHGFESDQDSNIVVLANYEQRRVLGDHRWDFLLTSASVNAVAGTAAYSLPASPAVMHMAAVRFLAAGETSGETLDWTPPEDLLDAEHDGATMPSVWSSTAPGTFRVYPAPTTAGVFTVRYQRVAADLALDADVPDIPAAYADMLVAGICADLAGRQRQWDAKREFAAERDERARALRAQHGIKQRQNSAQVKRTGRFASTYGVRGRTW